MNRKLCKCGIICQLENEIARPTGGGGGGGAGGGLFAGGSLFIHFLLERVDY